jgi:hypothetical protein
MAADHWVALRRPPERYPDAVTLVPGAAAAEVLRRATGEPGCCVKDSFADLDLADLGFDELFEARWIFREPVLPTVDAAAVWSVVQTGEELAAWALGAGSGDAIGPELLSDPSLRVLVARGGASGVRAGAIAALAADVVGISNVFSTKSMEADELWLTLRTAIANHFPMVPLVGYELTGALKAPLWAGFAEIGTLRVWRRAAAQPESRLSAAGSGPR